MVGKQNKVQSRQGLGQGPLLGVPATIRCYYCQQFGDHIGRDYPKLLSRRSVESLGKLAISNSHQVLRGFGGGMCMAKGEANLPISIYGVSLEVNVLIADCDLSGADLLLGQPTLACLATRNRWSTCSRALV